MPCAAYSLSLIHIFAVDGAKLVKQLSEEYEGNFLFEYSPESFTGTEVDYAVEVCNAVLDIMQPTTEMCIRDRSTSLVGK